MKYRISVFFLLIAAVAFLAGTVRAQELVYDQRGNQVSYDGRPSVPSIAFNGKDFAAFYHWSGIGDKDIGVYMRRIGLDGKPHGPQLKVLPLELSDPIVNSVWDGSAYTVYLSQFRGITVHIVRVDTKGKLLAHKTVPVEANRWIFRRTYPFVIGERSYFFFSSRDLPSVGNGQGGQPYVITHDKDLKETPKLEKLPSAGFSSSVVNGVALDPNKFLVLLGSYKNTGEIGEAALLHIGFDGKLRETIKPAILDYHRAKPAEKVETTDLADVVGPVFTGDGYILVGTEEFSFGVSPSDSYPYKNTSVKIDDSGNILDGPWDLGNGGGTLYIGAPQLLGQYVGLAINDLVAYDSQLQILGARGKHVTDISLHEGPFVLFFPISTSFAYSGQNCVTLNYGNKDRVFYSLGQAIFSNIITDPPFVKSEVVYFMADDGQAFGDTQRLIMWSVSSCTKVSLTGKGLRLKNVPPVFQHVIDTKGKKVKLRLRYTGTDGKNKKSKLVINP